jgi:hypothetical protein
VAMMRSAPKLFREKKALLFPTLLLDHAMPNESFHDINYRMVAASVGWG